MPGPVVSLSALEQIIPEHCCSLWRNATDDKNDGNIWYCHEKECEDPTQIKTDLQQLQAEQQLTHISRKKTFVYDIDTTTTVVWIDLNSMGFFFPCNTE